MAKKTIEITQKENELYNDMKKLAKRANQRILRLERLTGKEAFAVKDLADKLSAESLKAWTKTGRISVQKGLLELQMKSIIKATRQFLSPESISTVKKAKEYTKKISVKAGKTLSLSQANTYYRSKKDYKWIYEYFTPSEYWGGFVKEGKENSWSEDKFIDELSAHMNLTYIDNELLNDLKDLYEYSFEGI